MERFLLDCHTHTLNSDGHYTLSQMVESAIEKGLKVYTVTDHCEMQVFEKDRYMERISRCYEEFVEARERYGDKIKLLFGVEIGQPLDDIDNTEKFLDSFPFDFVLAASHEVKGWKDPVHLDEFDLDYCERLLHAYFDELLNIVRWGKFDVLAHITYPYRYIDPERLKAIGTEVYEGKIDEILREVAKRGKGIEINTAGLTYRLGTTSPAPELVKRFRQFGGEIVTFASDAHTVEKIARGYDEAVEIMRLAGFDRMCYFEKRSPVFVEIQTAKG